MPTGLGRPKHVVRKLVLFHDEVSLFGHHDQPQLLKLPQKPRHPWPSGAHHFRQLFMGDLLFDAETARVRLPEFAGQVQQRGGESMLTVNGHEIRDDLLLLGKTPHQVLHEAFE